VTAARQQFGAGTLANVIKSPPTPTIRQLPLDLLHGGGNREPFVLHRREA
jgi:hypothetical protein